MRGLRTIATGLLVAANVLSMTMAAQAAAGDIQLRLRGIAVMPSENSHVRGVGGGEADVDTGFAPELDITYFLTHKLSLELIAATTKHNVSADTVGAGNVDLGSVWVLPPTLTLQYHFQPDHPKFRPYVGAGVNYTVFWNENAPGLDVDYDDSFGFALQAGIDVPVNDDWFVNVDVKKLFLSTSVDVETLPGVDADVDLNPWVIGVGFGTRF